MRTDYSVTVASSSRELSAREKIKVKDVSNATKIDAALNESDSLIISPDLFVVLNIHNEKAKDRKDYDNYLIIDKAGNKFVTGSTSFYNAFVDIFDEMAEAGEEDYEIEIYKRPSKNYSGKDFITCSLV